MARVKSRNRTDSAVPAASAEATVRKKALRQRQAQANAPEWDLKAALRQTMGVDLTTINELDVTAQTILAELRPDLSVFPSKDHLAS